MWNSMAEACKDDLKKEIKRYTIGSTMTRDTRRMIVGS